jgi:AAA+ ATPase superfamily predicted ATPase
MRLRARAIQVQFLDKLLEQTDPVLLAIYGRRRIGKTFLVTEFFRNKKVNFFHLTGVKNGVTTQQVENFKESWRSCFKKESSQNIKNWAQAFNALARQISKEKQKQVLFFDELPWLAKKNSGFLEALDHFWNHHLSQKKNVICIVCGSSASWMIKKIVQGKSGFHMRLTHKMHLNPFNIEETQEFLSHLQLNHEQILSLYMIFGGVAKYLSSITNVAPISEIIQELIFSDNGLLNNEFEDLYSSLFDKPSEYIRVVKALGKHHYGLTREEITKLTKLSSGGRLSQILNDLEQSDFILSLNKFGKKKKEKIYILQDEYSLFCLRWVENRRSFDSDYWYKIQRQQKYSIWLGYAFEVYCLKHLETLKQKLGISGVYVEASFWRNEKAQIDLLLEREDRCIHIIEMKYSHNGVLNIPAIASELSAKNKIFTEVSKTRSQIINTLVTNCNPKISPQAKEQIHKCISL